MEYDDLWPVRSHRHLLNQAEHQPRRKKSENWPRISFCDRVSLLPLQPARRKWTRWLSDRQETLLSPGLSGSQRRRWRGHRRGREAISSALRTTVASFLCRRTPNQRMTRGDIHGRHCLEAHCRGLLLILQVKANVQLPKNSIVRLDPISLVFCLFPDRPHRDTFSIIHSLLSLWSFCLHEAATDTMGPPQCIQKPPRWSSACVLYLPFASVDRPCQLSLDNDIQY